MFWQGEPGYLWENSNTASKKLYTFSGPGPEDLVHARPRSLDIVVDHVHVVPLQENSIHFYFILGA